MELDPEAVSNLIAGESLMFSLNSFILFSENSNSPITMQFLSSWKRMYEMFCIFSLKIAENTSGKEVFFYGKNR